MGPLLVDLNLITEFAAHLRTRAEHFKDVSVAELVDNTNVMSYRFNHTATERCGCYFGEYRLWKNDKALRCFIGPVLYTPSTLVNLECWPTDQRDNFLILQTVGQQLMFMAAKLESLDWVDHYELATGGRFQL